MSMLAPRRGFPTSQRSSNRISNLEANKTLDDSVRKKRKAKQLDGLEQDNAHEDPHANIVWNKAAPKFNDDFIGKAPKKPRKSTDGSDKNFPSVSNEKSRKRRLARPEFNKQRFKKTFVEHVAEHSRTIAESPDPDFRRVGAYEQAIAPPSYRPPRKFCAVCGVLSKYCCTKCGARYCSLGCRDVHNDTRCMKWLA